VAGLVTYYTVFVIDLASRRVQILGSTPHPESVFMQQIVRTLTMAETGAAPTPQLLICDRDRKRSRDVRRRMRMPTPSDSCDRSKKNVSIASFRSERGTSGVQSRSLSSTIIWNGITRDSTIG
jgi:hypothetical protein